MRRVRGATAAHAPTSAAGLARPQQRSPLAPRSGGGAEAAGAGARLDSAQDLERAAMAEAAVRALPSQPVGGYVKEHRQKRLPGKHSWQSAWPACVYSQIWLQDHLGAR